MTEDDAIAYADKAVRQSQDSGATKYFANVQRGQGSAGEALKLQFAAAKRFSGRPRGR